MTGMRAAAGTKSKIFFVVIGSEAETEVRALADGRRKVMSKTQHHIIIWLVS